MDIDRKKMLKKTQAQAGHMKLFYLSHDHHVKVIDFKYNQNWARKKKWRAQTKSVFGEIYHLRLVSSEVDEFDGKFRSPHDI